MSGGYGAGIVTPLGSRGIGTVIDPGAVPVVRSAN